MTVARRPPAYTLWPTLPGLDAAKLYAAERQAIEALRSWHAPKGQDLSVFEGVSLGRLWRYGLILPTMNLFRQAARDVALDSPRLWEMGIEEKYDVGVFEDIHTSSLRRADSKARIFRLFSPLLRVLHPQDRRRSVLVMCSLSNRPLWKLWLNEPKDWGGLRLDFVMKQPPGTEVLGRALLRGSRAFDPRPSRLTNAQSSRVEEIRAAFARLPEDPAWRALFAIGGRDISASFAERLLKPITAATAELARKVLSFDAELKKLAPALVLLPQEASPDAVLLLKVARLRRIPVWLMNHGFPGAGYRFDDAAHCGELEADRILAWSAQDRNNYLASGAPPDNVVVAGAPAFDAHCPPAPPKPYRGVSGASVLIVAHSTAAGIRAVYRDDDDERYFVEIVSLLDRLGAARIVYKLHPGAPRPAYYEGLRARLAPRAQVDVLQNEPFAACVRDCDFVIGSVSTAVFETMLAGKEYFLVSYVPTYILEPFQIENPFVAKTIDDLERNLAQGVCVPREKILREFCGIAPGDPPRAARRVMGMIREELGA